MDIYTFGEGLRQRFEQAGKIVFEKAQQIFSDAEPIANDAKSVVAKAFEDSQRAAAKVDLGRAIENAQGAVHRAVKDVQGAAKNIDLNRFGTDIQKNAADAVDAINEAANNLHIEQLLSNSFADAENMAKIISHNADLPGAIGAAQGWVDESLRFAEEKASGIDLGHIFDDAKVWAVAHPIQTAFIVINILILFAPGLITGPLLSITGFGAEGITAGELINWLQEHVKLTVDRFPSCNLAFKCWPDCCRKHICGSAERWCRWRWALHCQWCYSRWCFHRRDFDVFHRGYQEPQA